MIQRDRLDPESRVPLEELLETYPRGFGALADLQDRRAGQ